MDCADQDYRLEADVGVEDRADRQAQAGAAAAQVSLGLVRLAGSGLGERAEAGMDDGGSGPEKCYN